MLRGVLAASLLSMALSNPANAGQPIKESLVECAVLVELLLGEQSFIPGQNKVLDTYAKAAASMRRAALQKADEGYVTRTADNKRAVWHQRWDAGDWDNPANRDELIEWWTYCFKLADHLNLKLEP